MLKYTVATDKSEVTLTLDTEITKLLIPFFRTSPCKISTKSFWMTPPIFFCLFVSIVQKYYFNFQSIQFQINNCIESKKRTLSSSLFIYLFCNHPSGLLFDVF